MKRHYNKQVQIGTLLAIVACVIWSGNFIVSRYAKELAGPISLAFFRWTIATISILPFALKNLKNEQRLFKDNLSYFFWMALVGVAVYNTMIYQAGHSTTAINMALYGSIIHPIVATLLAAWIVQEKLHWKSIAGIGLGVIGIIVLLSKGDVNTLLHFKFATGDLWMIGAGCCFGTYNVFVRKKPIGISNNSFLLVLFAFGTIMLFPFAVYEMNNVQSVNFSKELLFIVLYLGIGNSTIAYLLWNKAIQRLGSAKTALFGTLIPFLSSIEALFILNEQFTIFQIISGVIIISGIVINTWPSKMKHGN
ncbi:MAG: DMT family transporter [Sediminibacterium sp.]